MTDSSSSFLRRLAVYQKERFPLAGHGPLIAAFSFSAIGFSRQCRSAAGFVPWHWYAVCVLSNFALFFLLRVADEHKDNDNDTTHRRYLPVPRGLITLKELRITGSILLGLAVAAQLLLCPALLLYYSLVLCYLLLMRYEFFAGKWLNARPGWYMVSHMVIIPLADIYASSYDWYLSGAHPPAGLAFFFGVGYLNGMVLEIGRKLRVPEAEEPGVETYTKAWGMRRGTLAWLGILVLNAAFALAASAAAGYGNYSLIILSALFLCCSLPGWIFLAKPNRKLSGWIEKSSFLWALGMYLVLGGIPQLISMLQ